MLLYNYINSYLYIVIFKSFIQYQYGVFFFVFLFSTCDLKSFSHVRFAYWTDWGDRAFIGRVGMDGSNKTAVITTKIEWPNGVTIDYTNDKLYWSDAHLNYIE